MYGFTLTISCVKTSNILSKFVKYIDVTLFKAVIDTMTNPYDILNTFNNYFTSIAETTKEA